MHVQCSHVRVVRPLVRLCGMLLIVIGPVGEFVAAQGTPFKVEPGAVSDSLVVSDFSDGDGAASRIGLGTDAPERDLHIVGGQSATIRLEDTFNTPHEWDINALNTAFQIVDVTNGTVPFHISHSIPGSLRLDVLNAAVMGVSINRTGTLHPLHVGIDAATGNGAHVTVAGVWTDGSSREHKTDITDLDAQAAQQALSVLNPVTYRGKQDPTGEQYAGFIAEDVPELVATADRKGVAAIEVVAVVTKVVQEQQRTIETLQRQNAEMQQQNAALLARLEALEARVPRGREGE